MKTARFWTNGIDECIQCELCPHRCNLLEGATGLCGVREVRRGELTALGYGRVSSVALDPIEKKPLYHFFPASNILSIGGWGCNFACPFCQNWTISQQSADQTSSMIPEQLVSKAVASGSIGIAYTYNEPLISYEFVEDCAQLAKKEGLVNVLVTNGYVLPGPAAELLPVIDALNIDIKSMSDDFYRTQCHGRVEHVLAFAKQAVAADCHVEITNLVIPGLNDDEDLLLQLAEWVGVNLGKDVPLHLSAYRPQYKATTPATGAAVLERAREICCSKLSYVYLGNVMMSAVQDTCCSGCGAVLIERSGYDVRIVGVDNGSCMKCGKSDLGIVM